MMSQVNSTIHKDLAWAMHHEGARFGRVGASMEAYPLKPLFCFMESLGR
jgi:hypothetical protein